jgi:AcrR family transcriptional regulator
VSNITNSGRPRGRGRGIRAGLDLDQIVAAARSLRPEEVTMQAVADQLNVDRKAVNHHVGDRENLLRLVAIDIFSSRFSAVEISTRGRWDDACRTYATEMAKTLIDMGVLVEHLPLEDPVATRILDPTEALLATLITAGFDLTAAQRALVLLTAICIFYARDVLWAAQQAERSRSQILHDALGQLDTGKYETLARISADPVDTYHHAQLDFSLDVFIQGLRTFLPT